MHCKPMQKRSRSFLLYSRGRGPAPPALAGPASSKIRPRTISGPAMQAPTSKRQGLRKKIIAISKFHRRGEHCSPAKALCCRKAPPGWSRAPPLQYAARECVKFLSSFRNFAVGAGLSSARVCRTRKPENPPPHRWRACHAGPYKQKARLA